MRCRQSQRELRGAIEELEHSNDGAAQAAARLYGDLDRRIARGGAAVRRGPAGDAGRGSRRRPRGAPRGAAGRRGRGRAASTLPAEQAVYSQAFDALKAGRYSVAITGFKDFLTTYPKSALADNAQYWLGEAYYVTHDYDAAAGAFRTVIAQWPDSRKAPDAMLKLGYTQFEQKQYPAARATLDEVTKSFPGRRPRGSRPSGCAAFPRSPAPQSPIPTQCARVDASRAMPRLKVTEIFRSLQGEADTVGIPTVFVRLTGCPLRCQYCDTAYAFHGGEWWELEAILDACGARCALRVCHRGRAACAEELPALLTAVRCRSARLAGDERRDGAGGVSIARVVRVVDVKTPGSGEERRNRYEELPQL